MHFICLTKGSGGLSGVLNIISLLLIFALVLVLAYITARFVGKYQKNVTNNKSNIKVIESFRLGANKFIAIIEIAGDYFAVGIGKDEITLLDKINPDNLKSLVDGDLESKINFKDILSQIKNKESINKESVKDKESKDKNEK